MENYISENGAYMQLCLIATDICLSASVGYFIIYFTF